ncbi:MAG TPA: carboxypeptidase M32 [Puia sp.]|nr:carboxypeptidase M32 [Puia sp.]
MNLSVSTKELYGEYKKHMRRIADIKNASAVLEWDQETYLPSRGAGMRGQQLATLAELAQQLFTEEGFGAQLEELNSRNGLSEKEKRNVVLSWEDYNRQKKLSPSFIRSLTENISKSFHSWIEARKKNSFKVFEKDLDGVLQLKRQQAGLIGYERHPYDALLDEYEKGCTVALLDKTFDEIRQPLKELLDKIGSKKQVDNSFLHQFYPAQKQWDFGMAIIKQLGFDFDAGRQDIAEHPFTTSFNSNDVRVTTRINEKDCSSMIWSCIHEAGHALYEQGLPENEYGLPLGEPASLGMHESQSRLWENNIGRSLGFWKPAYPFLQEIFPAQLGKIPVDEFYKAINKVEPSFIRTEADELSYHFHIMIRYELEKLLIAGDLETPDIPGWWNEQYENYLGLRIPNDKKGCLQDVHWSHGSFGYFPTYSLGSFYAAQLFAAAEQQIPDLSRAVEAGDTLPLLGWLRTRIHHQGRMFTSEDLCLRASGKTLDVRLFLRYLLDKFSKIYEF